MSMKIRSSLLGYAILLFHLHSYSHSSVLLSSSQVCTPILFRQSHSAFPRICFLRLHIYVHTLQAIVIVFHKSHKYRLANSSRSFQGFYPPHVCTSIVVQAIILGLPNDLLPMFVHPYCLVIVLFIPKDHLPSLYVCTVQAIVFGLPYPSLPPFLHSSVLFREPYSVYPRTILPKFLHLSLQFRQSYSVYQKTMTPSFHTHTVQAIILSLPKDLLPSGHTSLLL